MAFSDSADYFTKIEQDYNETLKKFQKEMQEKMQFIFTEFFKEFPEVKTIHWTQYTPYFNDGDECVFGVNDVYFTGTEISNLDNAYGEDDENNISARIWDSKNRTYINNPDVHPSLVEAMRFIEKMVNNNYDLVKMAYGDHAWVRINKDGVDIEEYQLD